MQGRNDTSVLTVSVPHQLEPALLRALLDVRSAVNRLLPDWRTHPEESRFDATKRSYPVLRSRYPHLASSWWTTMTNETSATLNAWDRSIRRARRKHSEHSDRTPPKTPHRHQLKASLHTQLFRWNAVTFHLFVTIRSHVRIGVDLSSVPNPLFRKYGEASGWRFGLTLAPHSLRFHFRVPHPISRPVRDAGIDLNFGSADVATSDGKTERVDLRSISRLQERMVQKRQSIQRSISKDLRHQRAVLRRYHGREKRRVTALLHQAADELLKKAGERALMIEDLSALTESTVKQSWGHAGPGMRRRLSAWTHGRLAEIVSYKARTPIVWVNPEGTSQECPRCGGQLALPSGRRGRSKGPMTRQTVCGECGGVWHRDAAAAIVILTRGRRILRGAAVPPSARNALLEAATWRPREGSRASYPPSSGLPVEPMKEDDAKSESTNSGRGLRTSSNALSASGPNPPSAPP
jgi:IS605 OrfB family transposase